MRKRTVILLGIFIVLAVGSYIAYMKFQEKTPDPGKRKADITVSAGELLAAFDRDTASAKESYIGKILEVKGSVTSVDSSGSIVLGVPGSASSVAISLDRRYLQDIKKITTGQDAVCQGTCSGFTKAGSDPDDMFAALGTTVELNFAFVKNNK